ncbi:MAG: response regulator transcription factor [Anaerolineales bacterium]
MAIAKILLIESGRPSAPSFTSALEKKGFDVTVHHKLDKAIKAAVKISPDVLILDAASMRTSGSRMSRAARASLDGIPIILISPSGTNPDPGNGSSVTLVQPFTPRKLVNRVIRLLPGDERYVLQAGPVKLNLAQRKVKVNGREARLTPKQAKLLELFMHNPGKLLTRKKLIREVWLTDYTGDTRTLDVHMSWLRHAIEQNPGKPEFLHTIRGMGYRFDLPN